MASDLGHAPSLGRIVKTNSHVEYLCRVHRKQEEAYTPVAKDYAFGRFVAVALTESDGTPLGHLIGVVFNTHIFDPEFPALNRSQLDDAELAVTLPVYLDAAFTMVEILGIGWQDAQGTYHQTVPPHAPAINAEVRPMTQADVKLFHAPRDGVFQIDYLTFLAGHGHQLVNQIVLQHIRWLRTAFPEHGKALEVIYNIVAWRSIVGVAR